MAERKSKISKDIKNISDDDQMHPCADCGVMRSKDEGGTTFTVCDGCWDKHYKEDKGLI